MHALRSNELQFAELVRFFVARTVGNAERAEPGDVLEFASGDAVARAFLMPRKSELLMVEVDSGLVLSTDGEKAADRLAALHRLNESARFEHGWLATLDDDDMMVLHAVLPVATVDGDAFCAMIEEGLDRAATLVAIFAGMPERGATQESSDADAGMMFIRG